MTQWWIVGLALGTAAYLLRRSVRGKRRAPRLLALNLAVFLLVFALGESFMIVRVRRADAARPALLATWERQREQLRAEPPGADQWQRLDPDLGWSALPNSSTRAVREYAGRTIYDVRYDFDEHGLRIPPPHRADADECLLFFGCSYTFGEGVENDETLPWRVGEKTGGRYRVYNFALQGFGPQQMLTLLETGRVTQALDCVPRHVFYFWIGNHVNRVAGIEPWTIGSARYRLDADGTLRQDGHFGDGNERDPASGRSWLYGIGARSALLSEVYRGTVIYGENARLQAAVVAASRKIVQSRWPSAGFHVIFWDDPYSIKHGMMRAAYGRAGLELIDVTDMLPDFLADEDSHWLHPTDRHPNAATYSRLADYLVQHVLKGGPE